jgi:two-component system chemotaxis sensor kinase CheA
MQNRDELRKLMSELVSTIAVVEPADIQELERAQTLLDQIRQNVNQITDAVPGLFERATNEVSLAEEILGKILTQRTEDTQASLKDVSQKIAALQELIDHCSDGKNGAGATPSPAQSENKNASSAAPPEACTISADDAPLVLDFITESHEHIESAEAGLLQLENSPGDAEAINLIFRAFHTMKGMAGFLNLAQIGSLAHSAENLLDRARKGTLQLTGVNVDVIFESIDTMKKMLAVLRESLEAGKPVPQQTDLPQLLIKLQACAEGTFVAAVQDEKEKETDQQIEEAVADSEHDHTKAASAAAAGDEKIKVSMARLDMLVSMIGELVIAQSMVNQQTHATFTPEHDLCRKVSHQGKIVREMQELSMSLRMVPIGGLFKKMARLVRDLSHKAQKDVNFVTVGEETELDRNIVDMLSDPLVHMIRNCVDHGIEPAAQRKEASKNPQGTVALQAFHQSGNIVIQIIDDGKGLDCEKILKKAIASGIVQQGQELSQQEIFRLIFHAGLSTAEKITDISGRGVGMDVVRKNIEMLRGKIDISSVVGKGTTFSIRLPLTLAIIDGQIVRVGNNRYIVPISSIEHSLRPTAQQIATVRGKGEVVNVQGRLLPLIRLYQLFKVKPSSVDLTQCSVVVIEGDGKKCCLLVDELLGQQQVVIKSLGDGIGTVQGISGGAIMGDGNVSLILDTPGLMHLAWKK